MLNAPRTTIVLAVLSIINASVLSVAGPAAAKDPPDVSFEVDSENGKAKVIQDVPGNAASPGSGSVIEVTQEQRERWLDTRNKCMKIDDERAVSGDGSFGHDFYDVSCVARAGDPATAAQQVVASMDLHVPDIGIVPEPGPEKVGLVGLPNYMWVNNPEIFATVSDSASIDAWTISVSGRVEWVDWDMGDGQVIRCTGPGTPYEDRYDKNPSPDCGHVYSVQGHYTVRATARWVLQWSGGGQSGTVVTDRTSTVPIVVGEALAVRRK